MAKGASKVIVDAERHRRTPRHRPIESKTFECETLAETGDAGA